jgi:hypothetical protein
MYLINKVKFLILIKKSYILDSKDNSRDSLHCQEFENTD